MARVKRAVHAKKKHKKVLDRASGKLVECDAQRCPHAIDGINYAPFAAYGGWSGGINAGADDLVKDAAPIIHDMGLQGISQMNEMEKKGYFEFIKELFRIADRIIALNFGQKIADGQAADVMDSQEVKNAYLGSE